MSKHASIDIIHLPLNQNTIEIQQHLLNQSEHLLTTEEINHAKSYHYREDAERFKIARTLLKHLISNALHEPTIPLILTTNRHGKPIYNNVHFSISKRHCGIVIAISTSRSIGALGIDIEAHDEKHEWNELSKHCSRPDEYSKITSAKDFYCYWTAKEAAVKALGTGLSFPLQEVNVDMKQKTITFEANNKHQDIIPTKPWQLQIYQQADFTIALVHDNSQILIHCNRPSINNHELIFTKHFPLKDTYV